MTLFQYPKDKHTRSQSPRQYKRYQTYKRFLQADFKRVCVYCRQPDSSAPNLNFGADHYKPKSIYPELYTAYSNLYYCCGQCNSRKNNYWPADITKDNFIPNPCDHEMVKHLRFDANSGEMKYLSAHGDFTIELLQLNEESLVKYRQSTLKNIKIVTKEKESLEKMLIQADKLLAAGKISAQEHAAMVADPIKELADANEIIARHNGTSPLPNYSKSRATKKT